MCLWLTLFFFFKQKTAYELRISDWSSDVCSSDLPPCKRRVQERSDMGLHESRRRSRVGLRLPCHLLRREDLDLSPDRLNQSGKNDHEVAGMTGFQAGVYGLFFDDDLSQATMRGDFLTPALVL